MTSILVFDRATGKAKYLSLPYFTESKDLFKTIVDAVDDYFVDETPQRTDYNTGEITLDAFIPGLNPQPEPTTPIKKRKSR